MGINDAFVSDAVIGRLIWNRRWTQMNANEEVNGFSSAFVRVHRRFHFLAVGWSQTAARREPRPLGISDLLKTAFQNCDSGTNALNLRAGEEMKRLSFGFPQRGDRKECLSRVRRCVHSRHAYGGHVFRLGRIASGFRRNRLGAGVRPSACNRGERLTRDHRFGGTMINPSTIRFPPETIRHGIRRQSDAHRAL